MMFHRLPALKLPTDTTSDFLASTSRDGSACSAVTNCEPT
jgi:hypothetical protein